MSYTNNNNKPEEEEDHDGDKKKKEDESLLSRVDKVQKTQAQLDVIEQETKQSPLTSRPLPLSSLRSQYLMSESDPSSPSSSSFFLQGIDDLSKRYSTYRSTRGDGNCYYRAVLYSLAEKFVGASTAAAAATTTTGGGEQQQNSTTDSEYQRLLKYFETESFQLATSVGGYSEISLEIFHETLVEFWKKLPSLDATKLHEELNEENSTSEYCCWYLRSVASTFLKSDPDRFLPFLLAEGGDNSQYMDVSAFCASQIDPMGSEATQVTVLAVAEALKVRVEVEYLDGHPFKDQLTKHVFGEQHDDKTKDNHTTLTLLYRPGHYDILNK